MAHPSLLALLLAALCAAAAAAPVHDADGIIVRMASDLGSVHASAFTAQSAASADAAGELGQPIGRHLRRLGVASQEELEQQLQRLNGMKGVQYAVPDQRIYPARVKVEGSNAEQTKAAAPDVAATLAGLPTRKSFSLQWGAARVGLPSAWKVATGAAGKAGAISVCVVDSGVDLKHPDLVANLAQGFSAVRGDDESRPDDQVGHGTEVTGVIAASGVGGGVLGVNWNNVNILPCKFMSADGWGQTSDAIQCMDWCLGQGVHIISASWSCGQLSNPPLEEAVARTRAAGVLVVVAAGNQAANMAAVPYYPQAYSSSYDNLLVVGATDEYDDHAFFSNYDPATVHVSAPGHWIYSTSMGGGYNISSGTSIAAPFVSGSAALLMAVAQDRLGKRLTALQVKAALLDSAEPLAALAGRTSTGARLRTDWALQRLLGLELSPASPCLAPPGNHHKCGGEQQQGDGTVQTRSAAAPITQRQQAAASQDAAPAPSTRYSRRLNSQPPSA